MWAETRPNSARGPFLLAYRLIMHCGIGRKTPDLADFAGFVVIGKNGYCITI